MKPSKRSLMLTLIVSALLLNAASNGNSQSKPSPKKHKATAAISSPSPDQRNQEAHAFASALGSVLDELRTIRDQQETAEKERRAENNVWLTPLRIQKGLLFVGIVYSIFACLQWWAIHRQANIAQNTPAETARPWVAPAIRL